MVRHFGRVSSTTRSGAAPGDVLRVELQSRIEDRSERGKGQRFFLFKPDRLDGTAFRLVIVDFPDPFQLDDAPADLLLVVDALNLADESLVEPRALNRAFSGTGTPFL